jgi:replicative DNA helicase
MSEKLIASGTFEPPVEFSEDVPEFVHDRVSERERVYESFTDWIELKREWPFKAGIDLKDALYLQREHRDYCGATIDAIQTPFPTLNEKFEGPGGAIGLAHGWHGIIGARSNAGKTTLALNFAVEFARRGETVLFLALEGAHEDLTSRILAIVSGEHLAYFSPGERYNPDAHERAAAAWREYEGTIISTRLPVYSTKDLETMVRGYAEYRGVRTFVVDHLQLAKTGSDREIYDRVTEISHVCRTLARELKILSLCTSQLNRMTANQEKLCPTIHSLLGGTPLEADSDFIVLIDHCRKHSKWTPVMSTLDTSLVLGKNRYGQRGRVDARLTFTTQRFRER